MYGSWTHYLPDTNAKILCSKTNTKRMSHPTELIPRISGSDFCKMRHSSAGNSMHIWLDAGWIPSSFLTGTATTSHHNHNIGSSFDNNRSLFRNWLNRGDNWFRCPNNFCTNRRQESLFHTWTPEDCFISCSLLLLQEDSPPPASIRHDLDGLDDEGTLQKVFRRKRTGVGSVMMWLNRMVRPQCDRKRELRRQITWHRFLKLMWLRMPMFKKSWAVLKSFGLSEDIKEGRSFCLMVPSCVD